MLILEWVSANVKHFPGDFGYQPELEFKACQRAVLRMQNLTPILQNRAGHHTALPNSNAALSATTGSPLGMNSWPT